VDADRFMASRAPEEVKKYSVRVLPTMFVEDAQGREVIRYEGVVPRDEIAAQLDFLLK
jgi:thioredoxin-related protein